MPKIFISYRRDDSSDATGRIYDQLADRFGPKNVFIDVDTIPSGSDFRKHLHDAVAACDVMLVVIGRDWLKRSGWLRRRRLDRRNDFVRIEIETALERGTRVIPVLVRNARVPAASELPKSIQGLAFHQALSVRAGRDFRADIAHLIRELELSGPEAGSGASGQPRDVPSGRSSTAAARGVEKLLKAVRATFGPRGEPVVVPGPTGASVSSRGHRLLRQFTLDDRDENMAADLVRRAALDTRNLLGDGATRTVVLAAAIFDAGVGALSAGADPAAIKRGIVKAVGRVEEFLRQQAEPLKTLEQAKRIGLIAADNNDEAGAAIADCMQRVGRDGAIVVEQGEAIDTSIVIQEGTRLEGGYLSAYFVTAPERMEAVLEAPRILLYRGEIGSIERLTPLVKTVAAAGSPLLMLVDGVDDDVLKALVAYNRQGESPVCAARAPGRGGGTRPLLEDVACLTGGQVISADAGIDLARVPLDALGRAREAIVDRYSTTLIDAAGAKDAIRDRIGLIRDQIESADREEDRERLCERLVMLAGGVAHIRAGGSSEEEIRENRAGLEAALKAARGAAEEGILGGGGFPLLCARNVLDGLDAAGDEAPGVEAVKRGLAAPARALLESAGVDPSSAMASIEHPWMGYDVTAGAGAKHVDLRDAGIIDPAPVLWTAVANASRVACLLIDYDARARCA